MRRRGMTTSAARRTWSEEMDVLDLVGGCEAGVALGRHERRRIRMPLLVAPTQRQSGRPGGGARVPEHVGGRCGTGQFARPQAPTDLTPAVSRPPPDRRRRGHRPAMPADGVSPSSHVFGVANQSHTAQSEAHVGQPCHDLGDAVVEVERVGQLERGNQRGPWWLTVTSRPASSPPGGSPRRCTCTPVRTGTATCSKVG